MDSVKRNKSIEKKDYTDSIIITKVSFLVIISVPALYRVGIMTSLSAIHHFMFTFYVYVDSTHKSTEIKKEVTHKYHLAVAQTLPEMSTIAKTQKSPNTLSLVWHKALTNRKVHVYCVLLLRADWKGCWRRGGIIQYIQKKSQIAHKSH